MGLNRFVSITSAHVSCVVRVSPCSLMDRLEKNLAPFGLLQCTFHTRLVALFMR
jgi:hypothetical protein